MNMQIQKIKRSGKTRKNVKHKNYGFVESMRNVGNVDDENAKKGKEMKPSG